MRVVAFIIMNLIIAPLAEAVERLSEKTVVGSVLNSAEWAKEPVALRERAQFSAGVEEVRVLRTIQEGLQKLIGQIRNEAGVFTDRTKLIEQIGEVARDAGLTPKDPALVGTIQDITSERRAELIVDTQTEQAYGYANWKAGQDEDALDAFPAQELIRVEEREKKRDWLRRWVEAGGAFPAGAQGRMIALKTDPIWERLSRFGTPWPPFDFNSGMGVEDVSREEAIEFGVLPGRGTTLRPIEADFNSKMEAEVTGLSQAEKDLLTKKFGDQVAFDGDKVKWRAGRMPAVPGGAT